MSRALPCRLPAAFGWEEAEGRRRLLLGDVETNMTAGERPLQRRVVLRPALRQQRVRNAALHVLAISAAASAAHSRFRTPAVTYRRATTA